MMTPRQYLASGITARKSSCRQPGDGCLYIKAIAEERCVFFRLVKRRCYWYTNFQLLPQK